MRLEELRVVGYRSVRELTLPLRQVNVIVGRNGVGKSNLYRAVPLLQAAAQGRLARALAAEGGMPSVMWAGGRKQTTRKAKPVRLLLEARFEALSYSLALGLPVPSNTVFERDPEVKEELVWAGPRRKPSTTLLERKGDSVHARDEEGRRVTYPFELERSESVLAQLSDPHRYPDLSALREAFRGWRCYHGFRSDQGAPARRPQVAVRTTVLSDDGSDLACALQTIQELGDSELLDYAVRRALSGVTGLHVLPEREGRVLTVALQVSGLHRLVELHELSDGTLRYLCLVAALLSPRPPALLALNEPETSLHPDLTEPLADLLAHAAKRSQLWVTTHSRALAEAVEERTGEAPIALDLVQGATCLADGEGAPPTELEWT